MEGFESGKVELIRRAEELEEAGRTEEAFACWRAVVAMPVTDPETLCHFGDLAVDLGEWAQAEDAYSSAIRLAPEWAGPYEALGALYLKRNYSGDLDLALGLFEKTLKLEKTAHCYTLLGVVQDHLDRRSLARESYEAALRIDPDYEEAYHNLAVTYREEDPAKAIALFERAVEIDPQYQAAHRELGWALRSSNKYRNGEQHIRRALELDPSDGWANIYLGNLLWGKRDLVAAERAFLQAVEVWPDDSVPYWSLAMFYDYTDRPQEADLFYQKALHLNPDDPQANFRFGLYLKEAGHEAKAALCLRRAIALDPANERAKLALAELDESAPLTTHSPKIH